MGNLQGLVKEGRMQSNDKRTLLTDAIIAFDLMVKECIENMEKNEDFDPEARKILASLRNVLSKPLPDDELRQQYLFNVSEIAARIKIFFCTAAISDKDVEFMLKVQADRLKWLGKHTDNEFENIPAAGELIH